MTYGNRVECRKRLEAERMNRIFDAKSRTIGVDKLALDAQVSEKSRAIQLDKDRNEFFNSQAVLMDNHAVFMSEMEKEVQKEKDRTIQDYRNTYQKRTATREWDLNDPNSLKKDLPCRVGDNDPRCGIASLQKFEGEDLDYLNRKRTLQQDMQMHVQRQLAEKDYMKWLNSDYDRKQVERMDEVNQRAFLVEKQVQDRRKADLKATADFNKALAEQKQRERQNDKRWNTLASIEEIRNALDSDLLTENPTSTLNVNDEHRFKRYHMKGLLPDHRQAIYNQQAHQAQESKLRRGREREEERQWEIAHEQMVNDARLAELDQLQARKNAVDTLKSEWEVQAAEALQRKMQLNNTYRNDISDDFFNRFNTVTR